jgi:hypothetical protein
MFHCHILEHEDRGMIGQFVLVEASGGSGSTALSAPAGIFGDPGGGERLGAVRAVVDARDPSAAKGEDVGRFGLRAARPRPRSAT